MKKFTVITLSAMFCGLVVLSACGGGAASGSAASSDAPLGRVPAIFAEVAAKKKALDESLRKEDDLDRYQKKLKEFDEYAAKSYQKAAEEGEKLVGREIVCTGDVYPDFQITGAKVAEYHAGREAGSIIVRVTVTPKRDIVVRETKRQCAEGEYPLKDTRLYFALMKANDHLIELGQLNPFNGNSYNSSLKAEYAPGQMVQAGVPCHSRRSSGVHQLPYLRLYGICQDCISGRERLYGYTQAGLRLLIETNFFNLKGKQL